MKKIINSLLTALLLASCGFAQASLVDLSQDAVFISQDLQDYSSARLGHTVVLKNGAQVGVNGNYFSDRYYFSIGETYQIASLITSLTTAAGTGLTVTGFELRNDNGIVLHGIQDVSPTHPPSDQAWRFASDQPLDIGYYFIEVNGYVTALNGGSYSGNVAVTAAVPEADGYAMLLAGLGMVGLLARRRRGAALA